jgi:hypothetical protein
LGNFVCKDVVVALILGVLTLPPDPNFVANGGQVSLAVVVFSGKAKTENQVEMP